MPKRTRTPEERYWEKVGMGPNGCHVWLAFKNKLGYGWFWANGRHWAAHRYALKLAGREVPDHLVVDHLCRNPSCVRPDHLEAVTDKVNIQRGLVPKTHWKSGKHVLDVDGRDPYNGSCLPCRKEYKIEWQRANRAARRAAL